MHRHIIALLILAAAFAQSGYRQTKKITIGGEGGWDYLTADPSSGRVFVSHGNEVDVVDPRKGAGEVVGKIEGLHGVHGIALAPEFNRGFISNGQSNTVTIFDLKTLSKIGEDVAAGKNPDAIIYDPASKRIFAMNGRSSDATAIDAKTGAVAGTVALDGRPEFAAADGKGHVYINLEDKSSVVDVDSKKLSVEHRWPLAPCEEPSGMAMDTKTRRIFAGCSNKMTAVMDADNGKVVATVAIGPGVDATAFDPGTGFILNSCGGDGTLSVVHEDTPDKYTLVENVKTEPRARTLALDTRTHDVYFASADFETAPAPPAGADKGGKGAGRPRMRMVAGSFRLLEFSK